MLWAKMIFVSGKHGILILCLIRLSATVQLLMIHFNLVEDLLEVPVIFPDKQCNNHAGGFCLIGILMCPSF